MVSPPIPNSLRHAPDEETLVETIYFVVRVLRNAGRGYGATPVSPESSEAARALADAAIAEIESAEGRRIPDIDVGRLSAYIEVLESTLRDRSLLNGTDDRDAERILAELRASSL
jgi:hypothetical protein